MSAMRYLIHGAAAMLVVASTSAWPRSLDAQTLKDFGGTYMVDCKNNASAKVTVFANALVFLNGDKRVASNSIETGVSYFHPNPNPKGFLVTLITSAPGGLEMLWHVFQDSSGQYLIFVDADARSMAVIGGSLAAKKFRSCDRAATRVAVPTPPMPTLPKRQYALTELSASGILMDTKAKAAYYKSLGPLRREPWLARLDGPSSENKRVTHAGSQYILAYTCKNHDCFDNNTLLLYSQAQDVVYGKVYQRGKSTLIGAPSPALAKELDRLWREHFRRNS